jgi:hypothetical protein
MVLFERHELAHLIGAAHQLHDQSHACDHGIVDHQIVADGRFGVFLDMGIKQIEYLHLEGFACAFGQALEVA